jgi:hypothetical protein
MSNLQNARKVRLRIDILSGSLSGAHARERAGFIFRLWIARQTAAYGKSHAINTNFQLSLKGK